MKAPSIELLMQSLAYLDHTPSGLTLHQWELTKGVIDDVRAFAKKKRVAQYACWGNLCRSAEAAAKLGAAYPAATKFFGHVHVQKSVMFDQLLARGVPTEPLLLSTNTVKSRSFIVLTMHWDVGIVTQLSKMYIAVAREALGRNKG